MSVIPSRILAAIAVVATLGLNTAVQATPVDFVGNYTVSANTIDPGLVINTSLINSGNIDFSLSEGGTTTIDLFRIWTNETSVNKGDDLTAKNIEVDFLFSLPEIFGETLGGETTGQRTLFVTGNCTALFFCRARCGQ